MVTSMDDVGRELVRRPIVLRAKTVAEFTSLSPPPGVNALQLPWNEWPGGPLPIDAVCRPSHVGWRREANGGSESLLEGMSRKDRQIVRHDLQFFEGLQESYSAPVTPVALAEFEKVYRAATAKLPGGINLLHIARREILDPLSRHGLVMWHDAGRPVAGAVVRRDGERQTLVVRFQATAPQLPTRPHRGLYLRLADVADELGVRWFSLGVDPNFYGGAVSPGLCQFKLRLGMSPSRAQELGLAGGEDVIERLISTDGLRLPALRFVYDTAGETPADSILHLLAVGAQDAMPGLPIPVRQIPEPLAPAPGES